MVRAIDTVVEFGRTAERQTFNTCVIGRAPGLASDA